MAYCSDTIGGNACPASVLSNTVLVWRQVNAVDLVLSDVTVEPLNLRPHFLQRLHRSQCYLPDLGF